MTDDRERIVESWEPGVTPTWTECPHGVRIAEGTYTNPQALTGEHLECYAEFLAECEAEADAWHDEQWAIYRDMTGM